MIIISLGIAMGAIGLIYASIKADLFVLILSLWEISMMIHISLYYTIIKLIIYKK